MPNPRLIDICANCGKPFGDHIVPQTCPDNSGRCFAAGHHEKKNPKLDWDPKKSTPFDPFKDWGKRGTDWDCVQHTQSQPSEGEQHPLQKGVPKL